MLYPMKRQPDDGQYSDEEAMRRMNEALRRALTTPPKPQKEMVGRTGKAGKSPESQPRYKPKERPASKGRVHKGKAR
jgi:hypothetical protein